MRSRKRMRRRTQKLQDDVSTSTKEACWYDATANMSELKDYCNKWEGTQWLQCLDIFSFHRGLSRVCGVHTCASFDIRLDRRRHDVTTKRGCLLLLALGMALVPGAFVGAAPPCSLYVWLSSSQHKRHMAEYGPYGDQSMLKIRLSNLIVRNMAGRGAKKGYKG